MKSLKFILSLVLTLSLSIAHAQQTEWYMQADTNKILIGEQIQIKLRATIQSGVMVQWPLVGDTLNSAEVIGRSPLDTTALDSEMLLEQRLTITVWDSGYYVIQPLTLVINGDSILSDPLFLTVNTVEELAEQPFDIKAPEDAPKTLGEWIRQLWPWIVGLLALAAGVWWWMKKRPHRDVAEAEVPKIDPYEQAIQELGALRENKLWERGEVKEYYDALTDIGRRYLELERNIPALESTTDETRALLESVPVSKEVRADFVELMRDADMVKFAKEKFDEEACQRAYRRAKEFIDAVHAVSRTEPKAQES